MGGTFLTLSLEACEVCNGRKNCKLILFMLGGGGLLEGCAQSMGYEFGGEPRLEGDD